MRCLISLLTLVFLPLAQAAGPTGLLNDTGVTTCYDGSGMVACSATNTGEGAAYPRQDGRFGRDAKSGAGFLSKVGGGAGGFDFTKICWNGDAEGSGTCTGALVANTTLTATGSPDTDWACTRDNVTNLVWSLQITSGLNWAGATSTAAGSPIALTNGVGRCGFSTGWRVPTQRELQSIVHYGRQVPSIDGAYFPSTIADSHWTNDAVAGLASGAWHVDFNYGYVSLLNVAAALVVRLVHSGP